MRKTLRLVFLIITCFIFIINIKAEELYYKTIKPATDVEFFSMNTSYSYRVTDKNNNIKSKGYIFTGDKLFVSSSNGETEYTIIIKGDINADGDISPLDYVKVKNHIMNSALISSDVYLDAADISENNQIDPIDYVKIKNLIMKKKTINISFDRNGSNGDNVTLSCEAYYDTCSIKTPEIQRSNYEIIGWGLNSNTKKYDSNKIIEVDSSMNLQAITRKKVTVSFMIQDYRATNNSSEQKDCYMYNKDSSCSIGVPVLSLKTGYSFVGWNSNSTNHNNELISNNVNVSSNKTYYSITKKPVTITFNKNTTYNNNTVAEGETGFDYWKTNYAADELEYYTDSCESFNDEGCKLTKVPKITTNGHDAWGFSPNATGTGVISTVNSTFRDDITLYSRINNYIVKDLQNFNLAFKINKVSVFAESGVSESIITEVHNYLNDISSKMPVLFNTLTDIKLLTPESYSHIKGESSVGLTTGYGSEYMNIIINTKVQGDTIAFCITHELTHALDFTFKAYNAKLASDESDVIGLFNKYKLEFDNSFYDFTHGIQGVIPHPLELYSYNNNKEFFADALTVYYMNNFDTFNYKRRDMYTNDQGESVVSDAYDLYSNDEINNVILKYICLAKTHNYNLNSTECNN